MSGGLKGCFALWVLVAGLAACDASNASNPPCSVDGPWASVDLTPLHSDCSADPAICPVPYECLTYDLTSGLSPGPAGFGTLCELPCTDNHDCPQGYICQGLCMTVEAGLPSGFCIHDI